MKTQSNKEIVLEQALIAVIGAIKEESLDLDRVIACATKLLADNTRYRIVDHPHISAALSEIEKASKF